MTSGARVSLPVAVVMGRRMVAGKGWRVPSWQVVGVVSGTSVADAGARGAAIHSDGDEDRFLWGGLRLDLFRDAAGSYWANLTGSQPSLYVLCHETEGGLMEPRAVTADHDEASSGVEVDERVFATPIPPEVYLHLEAFVVAHHRPEEKGKRKRVDWTAGDGS